MSQGTATSDSSNWGVELSNNGAQKSKNADGAAKSTRDPVQNDLTFYNISGNAPLLLQGERFAAQDKQKKQKAVRIVSTGRQGRNPLWLSVEHEKTKSAEPGKRTRQGLTV